jgi:hypothetical protein
MESTPPASKGNNGSGHTPTPGGGLGHEVSRLANVLKDRGFSLRVQLRNSVYSTSVELQVGDNNAKLIAKLLGKAVNADEILATEHDQQRRDAKKLQSLLKSSGIDPDTVPHLLAVGAWPHTRLVGWSVLS